MIIFANMLSMNNILTSHIWNLHNFTKLFPFYQIKVWFIHGTLTICSYKTNPAKSYKFYKKKDLHVCIVNNMVHNVGTLCAYYASWLFQALLHNGKALQTVFIDKLVPKINWQSFWIILVNKTYQYLEKTYAIVFLSVSVLF